MREVHWRRMKPSDLDGVVEVARSAFPDHFEDRACFAERLELYPRGCFTLDEAASRVVGYLIAYPWIARSAPPLNSLIGALPSPPDVLYLHDLALRPEAQGQGHTRTVVDLLVAQAREDRWTAIALVAVNRASDFWAAMGFEAVRDAGLQEKLASYGAGAEYMMRSI